jgi:hypothetical protein
MIGPVLLFNLTIYFNVFLLKVECDRNQRRMRHKMIEKKPDGVKERNEFVISFKDSKSGAQPKRDKEKLRSGSNKIIEKS